MLMLLMLPIMLMLHLQTVISNRRCLNRIEEASTHWIIHSYKTVMHNRLFIPLILILLMNLPLNIMILIIIVHSIISSNNNSNNRKRLLRSNNYSPTRFKHANHNFKKMKTEKLQSPKSLLPGSLNSIVAMEIGARVGIRIQRKNNNRMYMMVGEMMPS